MEENHYKNSVKYLTGRNREVKLHGQSREGREQDPRQLFNETEMKEREIELKEKENRKKEEEERKRKEKEGYSGRTWNTQKEDSPRQWQGPPVLCTFRNAHAFALRTHCAPCLTQNAQSYTVVQL